MLSGTCLSCELDGVGIQYCMFWLLGISQLLGELGFVVGVGIPVVASHALLEPFEYRPRPPAEYSI